VHLPFWQAPDVHTTPHAPQLRGSVCVLTQEPLQQVPEHALPPQVQRPDWQVSPLGHALPHAPQFIGSFRLTQEPLLQHRPPPGGQATHLFHIPPVPQQMPPPGGHTAQEPLQHLLPAGHGLLHRPQLLSSNKHSTQEPLQQCCPYAVQLSVQLAHCVSVPRVVHTPLQHFCPLV
jgi:hypothetical protein